MTIHPDELCDIPPQSQHCKASRLRLQNIIPVCIASDETERKLSFTCDKNVSYHTRVSRSRVSWEMRYTHEDVCTVEAGSQQSQCREIGATLAVWRWFNKLRCVCATLYGHSDQSIPRNA